MFTIKVEIDGVAQEPIKTDGTFPQAIATAKKLAQSLSVEKPYIITIWDEKSASHLWREIYQPD